MAYRYILPILVAVGGCAADQSVGCDATKAVQVPLQPIGQVFTAPVNVNGHELRLLLDTGANQTMLTASAVQRWGIPQSGRTYGIVIGTAGGSK